MPVERPASEALIATRASGPKAIGKGMPVLAIEPEPVMARALETHGVTVATLHPSSLVSVSYRGLIQELTRGAYGLIWNTGACNR